MNYKTDQAETRKKLKPKILYSGRALDLGIKDSKRTLGKTDASKYKSEAWKRLREVLQEKVQKTKG